MEASAPHHQSRDRSRPPPFLRASSRSSSGTANARMTSHSNNSSVSNLASASPQPKHVHLSHRYHNSLSRASTSSAGDRPGSRRASESTEDFRRSDSRQGAPASSSYLQEKLDRERRNESERSASRTSNDMSASLELRAIQSSPLRSATADGRRPRSSNGADPLTKRKGLGLKEMEQTMTSLHKHNFDLKLELFHRRKKQNEMEDCLDKLEAEKHQSDAMNDKLIAELEKRDKAVEEAVAMIVTLEARLEQLLREREMVRQVDADSYFYSGPDSTHHSRSGSTATQKLGPLNSFQQEDAKGLTRMPSFVSDRSETTENLRSVYLGARASVMSLPRMSEDANDGDSRVANNLTSPSLSVLSESSFLSVYGKKNGHRGSSSPPTELPMEDGPPEKKPVTKNRSPSRSSPSRRSTTSKPRRSGSITRTNASGTFSSITELIDAHSPLQRLEKMEKSLAAMNDASRPGSQETEPDGEQGPRQAKTHAKTKQEKRDALRKVRTDTPFNRELANHHNLPPTPDTISTSTLRRFKNSNDTLSREKDSANDRSYLASETAASRSSSGEKHGSDFKDFSGVHVSQPPSTTAFNSRRDQSGGSSYFDNRLPIPARPRSADETTISHPGRGGNAWDSDSSEELDGNDSASLQDYWLRESLRPGGLNPAVRKSSTSHGRTGRTSPDLFSFPMSTRGWAADNIFGALGGNGYMGSDGPPLSGTLDALGESLPTPQMGLFGSGLASPGPNGAIIPPPPPNRRSSLHAHTGTSSASTRASISSEAPVLPSPGNGKLRKSPTRGPRTNSHSRSNSIDGGRPLSIGQMPAAQQPQPEQVPLQKQRHYPPVTGATNPPRGRGLNIFRRSGSHEPALRSAPPTETVFPSSLPKTSTIPMVGVPSWGKRADLLDDDRDSAATPPPILRNPRNQSRRNTDASSLDTASGDTPGSRGRPSPGSPLKDYQMVVGDPPPPGSSNSTGGRRKWLGLGSLRSRAG